VDIQTDPLPLILLHVFGVPVGQLEGSKHKLAQKIYVSIRDLTRRKTCGVSVWQPGTLRKRSRRRMNSVIVPKFRWRGCSASAGISFGPS
jgi:hypothetical protein